MYLNSAWRILTVGDGDLSFSNAIQNQLNPALLVASTFDDEQTINNKYADNQISALATQHIRVLTNFDVTSKESWLRLNGQQFDVVIFQFPLIPAFKGEAAYKNHTQQTSMNVLNRALLHQYLKYAQHYALDKQGEGLCFITSKDVKPYRQWNIEGSLNQGLTCKYLGQMPFEITKFPGYKIRNVDRDKHVKDTSGITYVFSKNTKHEIANKLIMPSYLNDNYCPLCRVGPYMALEDEKKHKLSKRHLQMTAFESQWQSWLNTHNNQENT